MEGGIREQGPWLGRDFVCGRCKKQADGEVGLVEQLCEDLETVRGFCYLGGRVNANWLGEVQGMWRVAELKMVLAEGEWNGLSELCKISDVKLE